MIKEIQSKKVLTFHPNPFPTHWDLNPYRGCTMGCKYCFAQYSHQYLGLEDFFKDILVKTNAHESLDAELRHKSWSGEQIKIGGITDLYQHIEKRYELMPKIFDVIKKHKTPIFIQTKSLLILRDFELIRELAKITTVDIATSVSSFDESLCNIMEPGAASPRDRLHMLSRFSGIARSTVLGFMPIIPLFSDTDENLETTFRQTKEYGIDHVVTSILHLRGNTKEKFLQTLQSHFPQKHAAFSKLYRASSVDEGYAQSLHAKIRDLRTRHGLHGVYEPVKQQAQVNQLSLF